MLNYSFNAICFNILTPSICEQQTDEQRKDSYCADDLNGWLGWRVELSRFDVKPLCTLFVQWSGGINVHLVPFSELAEP